MIEVKGIKKYYKARTNIVKAVDGINYEFEDGFFYALTGRSGSGKTTFLQLVGGLDKPDEGLVTVNGEDITKYSDRKLSVYRNTTIGFVFQSFYLENNYSCIDNVMLPLIPAKCPRKDRKKKAMEALQAVGLENRSEHKISQLSGGEMQRVAIARALVNDPSIILADEPTGNLDSENGAMVIEILKSIAESGKLVILITHNSEDAQMADIKLILKDGNIIQEVRQI